jgi:hypothetical protein
MDELHSIPGYPSLYRRTDTGTVVNLLRDYRPWTYATFTEAPLARIVLPDDIETVFIGVAFDFRVSTKEHIKQISEIAFKIVVHGSDVLLGGAAVAHPAPSPEWVANLHRNPPARLWVLPPLTMLDIEVENSVPGYCVLTVMQRNVAEP